jgi:outer membrane receptor protein involved in Fe transport
MMLSIRYYFAFTVLFFGFSPALLAQPPSGERTPPNLIGEISGKITDAVTHTGLEYATVSLIRLRDSSVVSGMITDSTGIFHLKELPFGKYRLRVNYVGYKNYSNDSILITPRRPVLELGEVMLNSNETVMQTVEIEGTKSMIQITPEKKIYNVSQMGVTQGGTAQDVLEQLPSITTDEDGKASMRGNGNLIILIDGKPSNLTGGSRSAVLDQIPANLIDRIEVITNPSARYDADGTSGIINVILKKNRKPGFFGSVNGNVGTNNKYNAGFNISIGNSKWNLSTGYTFRYTDNFLRSTGYRRNNIRDSVFYYDQRANGNVVQRSHMANTSIDFRPKQGHTITLNGNYNRRGRPLWEKTEYNFLDQERVSSGLSSRPFNWWREGYGYEGGLSYTRDFKKQERKLNALVNYSRNFDDIRFYARQDFWSPSGRVYDSLTVRQQNKNITNNSTTTAQLDYIHPFKNKQRLEFGAKSITRTTDQDFLAEQFNFNSESWYNDTNLSNRFNFTESVNAGYGIYAGEHKKFEYQLGLRLEQTFTVSAQRTTNQKYRYDYFSWFPSVHASYKLTDIRQIHFNYSRRINRADFESLNPFLTYTDPLNTQRGNPQLRPEYINSFELQYVQYTNKLTLTATVYYRYLTQQMIRYRTLSENGVANMTWKNLNDNHSYGAEAIAVNRWFKWWNTNTSLNVYQIRLNDPSLITNANATGWAWVGKITSNFILPKKIELQISYNYRSPFVLAQGEMKHMHGMDASIKIPVFKDKGSILANVTDIFDTRQFMVLNQGPGFRQDFTRKRETRIAYIGFNYAFGNLKSQPKPKKRSGRPEGEDGGGGGDVGF